jgi:hypothetical protein
MKHFMKESEDPELADIRRLMKSSDGNDLV